MRSHFVTEFALEDKDFGAIFIFNGSNIYFWLPTLETHDIGKAALLVQRLVCHT